MPREPSPAASKAPIAAAALMVRDYEMRMRQLERQCRELGVENLRLRGDLEVSRSGQAQSRELNLRLGQEVLEARRQRLEARSEAEKFSEELSQVRQSLTFDVPTETPTEPCLLGGVVPPPGLLWPLIESSPAAVEGMSVGQKCACHGVLASWGCEEHQVYTDRLLLAHRDKSLDVARGPPGLERPLAASEHMLVAKDVTYALRAPRRRRTWVKPSRCVD